MLGSSIPPYRPQLATLVERPPSGERWLHELKYDGYRIACFIKDGIVRLESRHNKDWTREFPEIVEAARHLPVRQVLLDGEVAIVLANGVPSFQALQNAFKGGPRHGLVYFVFDLLHLEEKNIGALPLEERKGQCEALLRTLPEESPLRYSQHFEGDGTSLLERACALGIEGIVSKRRDQPYRAGRSDAWQKAKCSQRREFVIGGFTDPEGSRTGIGSLLMGEQDGHRLRFVGKVGTGPGFTSEYLVRIRRELELIEQSDCPFEPRPPGWLGRNAHWVRPMRRGEVVFTELTDDHNIRHGSFQGFRDTANLKEPALERVAPTRGATVSRAAKGRAGLGTAQAPGAAIRGLTISTPERLVYPALGFTKYDLATLVSDVAEWIMPHIGRRPLTLVRCDQGVTQADGLRSDCKFLKHEAGWHRWAGPAIRRVPIPEQKKIGEYLVVDSAEGLVGLVQGDILEIHVWNSTIDHLEQPDRIVLDLDPGAGVEWKGVVDAARMLRDELGTLGIQSWPKLTGGKGIHVVLPFQPEHSWDEVYELSRQLAKLATRRHPDAFTLHFARERRAGKILIDYKRNHRGAVAVAAYSPRARAHGPVGVPVSWRELGRVRSGDQWSVRNLRQRLRLLKEDPWKDLWVTRQRLPRQ